ADLGPHHAVGPVEVLPHRVVGDGPRERRPPGARLVLHARLEERVAARRADVGARVLGAEEAALEGRLGAVLAQDPVLLGRQAPAPLLLAEPQDVGHWLPPGTIMTPIGAAPVARAPLPRQSPARRSSSSARRDSSAATRDSRPATRSPPPPTAPSPVAPSRGRRTRGASLPGSAPSV